MNREIKFRAWITRYDDPYMMILEPSQSWFDYENGFVLSFNEDGVDDFAGCEQRTMGEPFEIMQYTGLKDNNGVEIYEGDVVRYDNGTKAVVLFHDGGFCSYDGYASSSDEAYFRLNPDDNPVDGMEFEFEIIGNIHENPELLNK